MTRTRIEIDARSWIRDALRADVERILFALPSARRLDVEGVHRTRAGVRRLRADLKTFAVAADPSAPDATLRLAEPLKRLGEALGGIREWQVQTARLVAGRAKDAVGEGSSSGSGSDADVAAALFADIEGDADPVVAALASRYRDRIAAHARALREELSADAFWDLLDELTRLPRTIPLRPDLDRMDEPRLVEMFARPPWRRLVKLARRTLEEPAATDEAYHRVRLRAKRARYAAEALESALIGGRARSRCRRLADRCREIQDILGEHQDAVVALGEIETLRLEWAADGEAGAGSARAEALIRHRERERNAARAAIERFRELWPTLDRKSMIEWWRD